MFGRAQTTIASPLWCVWVRARARARALCHTVNDAHCIVPKICPRYARDMPKETEPSNTHRLARAKVPVSATLPCIVRRALYSAMSCYAPRCKSANLRQVQFLPKAVGDLIANDGQRVPVTAASTTRCTARQPTKFLPSPTIYSTTSVQWPPITVLRTDAEVL